MKLTRNKIMLLAAAVLVLALAFWYGGSAPSLGGQTAAASPTPVPTVSVMPQTPPPTPTALPAPPSPVAPVPTATPTPSAVSTPAMAVDPERAAEHPPTSPPPEDTPPPTAPPSGAVGESAYTCTLSVRCDTLLGNLDYLAAEKVELVPEDGVIFPATTVTFYEGESVFNLLQREMKAGKIHMEFANTPLYNSAYIEGIANLYEFDCGELSGWMYKVNSLFPNYGASRYLLQEGDVVEWVFTCDLGKDVGDASAAGGQKS